MTTTKQIGNKIEKGLEDMVIQAVKEKLAEAIRSWHLRDYVQEVIEMRSDKIKEIVLSQLDSVLDDKDFHKMVGQEYKRKVAKVLVGSLSGAIESSVNTYKKDPLVKAKMIIALEKIVCDNPQTDD